MRGGTAPPRTRRASRPRVALAPMLAVRGTEQELAGVDERFLLSTLADGWRCLVVLDDRVRVRSRSGRDLTGDLPAVAEALRALRRRGVTTVLDGILVLPGETDGALPALRDVTALEVLDVLCAQGRDVTALPLRERRTLLRAERWPDAGAVRLVDAHPGDARATLAQLATAGRDDLLLARRADAPYRPGRRSADWLAFGARDTDEVLLCGVAASGALVLGAPSPHGLVYVGLAWPTRHAQQLAQRCREGAPPLVPGEMWPSLGAVTWLEPDLWLAVAPDVRPGSGRGGPRHRLVRVQEDLARPLVDVLLRAAGSAPSGPGAPP
jgi:bifunctional non-homologous end joining protein LigD